MKATFYICKNDGLDTRLALIQIAKDQDQDLQKVVLNGFKSRPGLFL